VSAKTGSHDAMMQAHPGMKTANDCTLGCVKAGGQYVLYNSSNKTVYESDDPKKAQEFAGQMVMVAGNLTEPAGQFTSRTSNQHPHRTRHSAEKQPVALSSI
jgi:hypothetical protein